MSELTAEQIHQLAERMGWEVETGDHGEMILITGTLAPGFDPDQARQRRAWEARDAQEKTWL